MTKVKTIAFTSLLLALTACGNPSQNGSSSLQDASFNTGIIGGSDVAASDSISKTTVGLVLFMGNSQATCTGSLVAPNVVLTAAHCLVDADSAVIVFGTDIAAAAQAKKYLNVTNVYIHPGYKPGAQQNSNDLALAKFSGSAPVGYTIANLLADSSLLTKNLAVILAGYGASSEQNGKLGGSEVLRKASVTLTNPTFSQSEMLFSSANGAGACHGDSGGPAFANLQGKTYLIGVTSRTTDDKGGCHKDSIYTNVAAFKTFIDSNSAKLQKSKK